MGPSGVVLPFVQWGGEAGLLPNKGPSIQLGHLVPKINMDWSSWLLSPSMGLESCAGRQDMPVQPRSVLQPTLGDTSPPCCCHRVPGLVSEPQTGI